MHGTRLSTPTGRALLKGQQALYSELDARFRQLAARHGGKNRSVIFNGIRQGQQFAAIPNLLPYADGGEMEGWLNGGRQRFNNGSLNPARIIPTFQSLINASQIKPAKEVLLKAVPGGGYAPRPSDHWSAAQYRAAALAQCTFPLAAFLIVAGEKYLMDYTYGYRSNAYVPPVDGSGGAVPGLPRLQSLAPEGWYPDYLQAPGTPVGGAVFDGKYTFSREWSGVSVSVNVRDETAQLHWKLTV